MPEIVKLHAWGSVALIALSKACGRLRLLGWIPSPVGVAQINVLADADASRFNRRRYLSSFAKIRDHLKDSIPIIVLDSGSRHSSSMKLEPQINMADCEKRLWSGSAGSPSTRTTVCDDLARELS